MGWQDLLASGGTRTLPWLGGREVFSRDRTWVIQGRLPAEHGWYEFETSGGRKAQLAGEAEPDPSYEDGFTSLRGYLVGNRFIADDARVDPDPAKLIDQTEQVFCIEPGLDRFTRAVVVRSKAGLVYIQQEFPEGAEYQVLAAYQDRLDNVDAIVGVTPALDLAFRWITYQRARAEERQRELERIRLEEERKLAEADRLAKLMKDAGTAVGRRELAKRDFNAAAREALRVSGAELLDVRDSANRGEKVVQYRFRNYRLECVVDKNTLGILDAGVCLDDHRGEKGDTYFTLESLPGVIGQAIDEHKLVIWRHLPGGRHHGEWHEERW